MKVSFSWAALWSMKAGLPHGALLIVNAEVENEVREKLKNDPWFTHGILKLENVKRWQIFIDARK